MKTAVSTDSNSGLAEGADGVFVLPMPVIVGGAPLLEGVDVTHEQLYEAMGDNVEVSSSQPSPGRLKEFWDRILSLGYDEVVHIPMSSGLSNSYESAASLSREYGGKVLVVDNHRISVTQAESALSALALARRGVPAADIREHLEERSLDASIYVTVDSMEHLRRGGRVTPAAAAFATVLNVKPVLTIQGDKLDMFVKARGMKQAGSRMIEAVRADRQTRFSSVPDSRLRIETAGTFDSGDGAQRWLERVREAFPGFEVPYVSLPCSIACHVGTNAAGIAIFELEA